MSKNKIQFTMESLFNGKTGYLVFAGFAVFLFSLWGVFNPVYQAYVINSIDTGTVIPGRIVILGILLLLWGALSVGLQGLALDRLVNKIRFDLHNRFMQGLLKKTALKLSETGEGKIITNLTNDVNAVSGIAGKIVDLVRIPVEMVMAVAILLYTNYRLAVIFLVILPPVTFLGKKIGNLMQEANKKYLTSTDMQVKLVSRLFRTINTVKTYAAENLAASDFLTLCFEKYKLEMKKVKLNSFNTVLVRLIRGLPFTILFLLGAFLFQSDNISVAVLALFMQLLNKVTVPFTYFGNIYLQYKEAKVSFERLQEILKSEDEDKEAGGGIFGKPVESIRFKDTGFKYKEKTVFEAFNLLLSPGKYYAAIGENGSGKSTFAKLLLNLYSPSGGSISANGTDYKNLDFEDMRKSRRIVYIEDAPAALFDEFDRNIILSEAKDEARFREVLEAVGLDAIYGEISQKNADELSAGQKQRVSIARALYQLREGSVLVMDEAFSSIDADGVAKMHKLFAEWRKRYNLTIFEITHNLSDMERFDCIYFFEDGNIALEGNHVELLEQEKYRNYLMNYQEDGGE